MTSGKSEWTSNIQSQVSRMTELIQRLLVLARMEEGNLKVHFSDFSLTEAAIQSAEPFITLALSQGKTMSVDVPEKLSFHGDERSIRELISILCDNAVKYCDDNGSISLSIQNMGKKNRISVANTCINADKSDPEKWFGRFYREDSSRSRDTGGFGIGLSIAKAISDAHKGKIRASYVDGTVIVDIDI
jgi:signal transduction histidine kinase